MSSAGPVTTLSNTRSTRLAREWRARRGALSCTHDANAWAGRPLCRLPAPGPGERVIPGSRTATDARSRRARSSSPQWARRLASRFPGESAHSLAGPSMSPSCCPASLAAADRAARGQARRASRYEVIAGERAPHRHGQCRARRSGARPASAPGSPETLGKGYLLPAPHPAARGMGRRLLLPTPMALSHRELPVAALISMPRAAEISAGPPRPPAGATTAAHVARRDRPGLGPALWPCRAGSTISPPGEAGDGWLHALFRYRSS